MSMLNFLKNYGATKANQGANAAIQAIVSLDPATATEAELRSLEEHLDGVTRQLAVENAKLTQLSAARTALDAALKQHLDAADVIQHKLDAADDVGKARYQSSLNTLANMAQSESDKLDEAKRDESDQAAFVDELKAAAEEAAGKLRTARSSLESARRDMERAAAQKAHAQDVADHEAAMAGLRTTTSGLDVALNAMHSKAEQDRQSAEAATTKAHLIHSVDATDDPTIADAMAAVSGTPTPATAADRLAALRAKHA